MSTNGGENSRRFYLSIPRTLSADHGTDGCVGPKTVQVACKVSKHGNSTLAKRDCIETFPL